MKKHRPIAIGQRGSAAAWIITILVLIVVAAGGYLMAIKFGMLKAPDMLAKQPWMATFIPAQPAAEGGQQTVPVGVEDQLRQQVVLLRAQFDGAQSSITAMQQQLDEKDRVIQERDDEIARLRDAINLAATQNISNVALIYEAMDPQEAATILANLGAENAALIIGKMRENKAAAVMALLDPLLATQITQILAGFGSGAPAPAAPRGNTGAGTQPGGTSPPTIAPGGGGATQPPAAPGGPAPANPGTA
jgi:flagellar motility protein MotE (MotC chaperone)